MTEIFYYVNRNEGQVLGLIASDNPNLPWEKVSKDEYESLGGDSKKITYSLRQQIIEKLNLDAAKIKALSDRNDFLEECIVEMAGLVYGE